MRSGMNGLPQSRAWTNDQSSVTMSPTTPAARARSIRWTSVSRDPLQYTWRKVCGLAATTSSIGLLAKELSPMATPRAAAARATASSPSGCTACTPVGDMRTGMAISWPITTVACSRLADRPAMWGAKPSSPKAATLSASV
jgi:hypothetical protein